MHFVILCLTNLTQLVEEPTHIMGNCLDLILTNTPDNIGPIHITQESLRSFCAVVHTVQLASLRNHVVCAVLYQIFLNSTTQIYVITFLL